MPFQDRSCFIHSAGYLLNLSIWKIMFSSEEFPFNYSLIAFLCFNFSVLFLWDCCPSDVGSPGIILVFSHLFLLFPSLCHSLCFLGVLFNFIFLCFYLVFHFCHQAFTFSKKSFFLGIFLLYNILLFNKYRSL